MWNWDIQSNTGVLLRTYLQSVVLEFRILFLMIYDCVKIVLAIHTQCKILIINGLAQFPGRSILHSYPTNSLLSNISLSVKGLNVI